LVENRQFEPTPLIFVAPVGSGPLVFHRDLWHQKTKVPGLSYCVVCAIPSLAVLVERRLVTDRRTDGRTHDDGR